MEILWKDSFCRVLESAFYKNCKSQIYSCDCCNVKQTCNPSKIRIFGIDFTAHFLKLIMFRELRITMFSSQGCGHLSKFRQECASYFLGLIFGQVLFFCVGKFLSYFFKFHTNLHYPHGSDKFLAIFWGLPILLNPFIENIKL